MRLIVMGQQAFGKDVLQKILINDVDEVVAVYCEPDKEKKPIDPIKEFALEKGIEVIQPDNFSNIDTQNKLKSFEADLMIMAFVNIFVPGEARDIPRLGSICFHPSLLPLHRGPSAVNWPIIMGKKNSGFSWFYPTDGLDEGDVLLQWECAIDPNDTVIDLYFKKIYPEALNSVSTVCDLFRSGKPPRIVQDEAKASYERRCTKKHTQIDWHKPVRQVYDLIRGSNPAPGAWTTYKEKIISIYDSEILEGDGVSGRVVDISSQGITVQCIGGRILIKRVKPDSDSKQTADSWAGMSNLNVGENLGT
ncbi:MAG: methionyl-tRNA formyltransferase [Paracoccaceae bacterium]